jgi:hypothetical protein
VLQIGKQQDPELVKTQRIKEEQMQERATKRQRRNTSSGYVSADAM